MMLRIITLLSVLALAIGGPAPRTLERRFNRFPDGRIVGGHDVDISQYPHQISLQYYGSHICGGSLISDRYVVTAAHCTSGSSASQLSIRAGSSRVGQGGNVVNVARIHQNPNYSASTVDFDVSVLELSSSVPLGSNAQPVSLADSEPSAGTQASVSGWGATSEGGSGPSQLQAVDINIVSRNECRQAYGSSSISERMICAGVNGGGKDSCQGDSGGPLIANGVLSGIVSWGYGCARPGYPGVYSNVAALRSYIREVSGI